MLFFKWKFKNQFTVYFVTPHSKTRIKAGCKHILLAVFLNILTCKRAGWQGGAEDRYEFVYKFMHGLGMIFAYFLISAPEHINKMDPISIRSHIGVVYIIHIHSVHVLLSKVVLYTLMGAIFTPWHRLHAGAIHNRTVLYILISYSSIFKEPIVLLCIVSSIWGGEAPKIRRFVRLHWMCSLYLFCILDLLWRDDKIVWVGRKLVIWRHVVTFDEYGKIWSSSANKRWN